MCRTTSLLLRCTTDELLVEANAQISVINIPIGINQRNRYTGCVQVSNPPFPNSTRQWRQCFRVESYQKICVAIKALNRISDILQAVGSPWTCHWTEEIAAIKSSVTINSGIRKTKKRLEREQDGTTWMMCGSYTHSGSVKPISQQYSKCKRRTKSAINITSHLDLVRRLHFDHWFHNYLDG